MKVSEEHIRQLFERYYNGQTSLTEERELKSLATSMGMEMVSPDLQQECELIADIKGAGKDSAHSSSLADAAFLSRLSLQVSQWDRLETHAQQRALRKSWHWLSGIAATFAIALLLPLAMAQYEGRQYFMEVSATISNGSTRRVLTPEEAAVETQRALEMFSETINKGIAMLSK